MLKKRIFLLLAFCGASSSLFFVFTRHRISVAAQKGVPMKQNLVLYVGTGCSFCARVTNFLMQHDLAVETKDIWRDKYAFDELKRIAGKTTVPCLVIDGKPMHESAAIIEYFKTTFNKK